MQLAYNNDDGGTWPYGGGKL